MTSGLGSRPRSGRNRRRWVILACGVGLVLLPLIVILPPNRTAPRLLDDGRALESLVSSTDSSIIVIYDPAVCFRCDMLLPVLEEWADSVGSNRFALVLTREPSEEETSSIKKVTASASLGSVLFAALAIFFASPVAVTQLSAEMFYRKGAAPPGELCPLWCKYWPCCMPPGDDDE